jgi:K+ transporter
MTKVMAVLRTLFLFGIAAYLLWAMPLAIMFSSQATREAACFKVPDIDKIASGGWIAVAWIAMETVFGWSRVWLEGRRQLKALKVAAAAAAPAPKPGA